MRARAGRTKPQRKWTLSNSGSRERKTKLGATVIKAAPGTKKNEKQKQKQKPATRIGRKLEFQENHVHLKD